MKKTKIFFVIVIVIIVTVLAILYKQPWVLMFYNTILTFFPSEIKKFFERIPNARKIRLSYSYIFRIEIEGNYLLVKDEQGRNNYHPVGGVFKYDPDDVAIDERFDGVYDGVFNLTEDSRNDLRIIIKKNKYKQFKAWFASGNGRENFEDLSREFREELIDNNVLPIDTFDEIKYLYIGSYTQKSYNKKLKMNQIRHYDILKIKLTNSQRTYLQNLMRKSSDKYLFANRDNILRGRMDFGGTHYDIADYTNLILVDSSSKLSNESDTKHEYSTKV